MSAVLVVRPSSLGDIVYALAIVSDIAQHDPQLAVDWVAERAFVPLVQLDPRVRRVIPLGLRSWREQPLRPATWHEMRTFRRELVRERYSAVLNLQEQVKGAIVTRMARGTRHGFDVESVRERASTWFDDVHHHAPRPLHFVERCRRLAAAALGYEVAGPPRWQWRPGTLSPVPMPRPYVVALHMSSRAEKWWPQERWSALLRHVATAGFDVVVPWGDDDERARSEALAKGVDGVRVPPHMTLPQIASLLQSATVVVGVDTGLTHFAAALQTPTVALFTTTDARQAGVAITGNGMDLGGNGTIPTVDEAIAATALLLHAQPRC